MSKKSVICFRASEDLHESLQKVAQDEKRSLSSIIEFVLTDYLHNRKISAAIKDERRQYKRKNISAATLIKHHNSGEAKYHTGSIIDISFGGVRIKMPSSIQYEIMNNPETSKLEIIFTLPNENLPIFITCEPRSIIKTDEAIQVGAAFVNTDLVSYKALQSYLM
jgi:hypothetical protein